jgi:hypothetical protein
MVLTRIGRQSMKTSCDMPIFGRRSVKTTKDNSAIKNMTQRDYMRLLYRQHEGSEALIINAYADAEEKGVVHRKQNNGNLTPLQYAKALYQDGIRKGWIIEH